MANVITKTKISEGPKRAVFHFVFEADGLSGELDNVILLDPQIDFNTDLVDQITITKLWYGQAVYDSVLKFNALQPVVAWVIVPDADSHVCFDYFGGIKDRSTVAHDGKLMISTNGFDVAGTVGTMIIEVKKD